ncbi:MAG: AAA family ATPase [Nitrospira sp.]|nr:AAA family ATPase [Nitrospira sp.]
MDFWSLINTQIQGNEFFRGGLALAVFGSLVVWCRRLPSISWHLLKRLLIVECDVQPKDEVFQALVYWLSKHPYGKRVKRFTASIPGNKTGSPRGYEDIKDSEVILYPAPGNHWLWFQGRLIRVYRNREKVTLQDQLIGFYESFTLQTWGKNRHLLESLIREAVAAYAEETRDYTTVRAMGRWDGWQTGPRIVRRSINSVILDKKVKEFLVGDVENFLSAKKWYTEMGVPYRRGYLFYGPPGTGKTSLCMALAGHFGLDVAAVSLNGEELDDIKLATHLFTAPEKSILLLEDLDCLYEEDRAKKESTVTLSGLMNMLDGALSQEGRIVIMTTNKPGVLDEALIRPGRADIHLHLGLASTYQLQEFFRRFFPTASGEQATEFANRVGDRKESPANIQRYLMSQLTSPEQALENSYQVSAGRFSKEKLDRR